MLRIVSALFLLILLVGVDVLSKNSAASPNTPNEYVEEIECVGFIEELKCV